MDNFRESPTIVSEYLNQKLKEKNWTIGRFEKEISRLVEIDGGTIRQIFRGTRSLPTKYIGYFAQLLNIDQKELKSKVIETKIEGAEKRNSDDHRAILKPFVVSNENIHITEINEHRPIDEKTGHVKGVKELSELMISMVERLVKIQKGGDIFITFQGAKSIFEKQNGLEERWHHAREAAMMNGFRVTHLIRLDGEFKKRTYEIIAASFRYLKYIDSYDPRCFDQKSVLLSPYGLIVIPGQEGILALSTKSHLTTDAAIYTKDLETLNTLAEHFLMLKQQTKPIFNKFETYEQPNFIKFLEQADMEFGDRIVISRRLSEITRPLTWYEKSKEGLYHRWAKSLIEYLEKHSPPGTDLSQHIANRRRRAQDLEKHLKAGKYYFRYVYPKKCIEEYISTGKANPYYFEANNLERKQQIQRMIDLLKYKTYEVALIDETALEEISPTFCEVQGNHIFFAEVLSQQDGLSVWYVTEERVIVRAFQEHLSKFWSKISDDSKNKFYVSEWLKQQIRKID